MLKDLLKKGISKLVVNRYSITIVGFLLWIVFFDENSISSHLKDLRHLNELHQQKEYYRERIEADKRKFEELNRGNAELEKFAREQFYMSKPDEDVFIVVEE